MIKWLDTLGYSLCWHRGWLASLWCRIWYHHRCPYPIISDHSARACIGAGHCGCDNGPRLAPHLFPQETAND